MFWITILGFGFPVLFISFVLKDKGDSLFFVTLAQHQIYSFGDLTGSKHRKPLRRNARLRLHRAYVHPSLSPH